MKVGDVYTDRTGSAFYVAEIVNDGFCDMVRTRYVNGNLEHGVESAVGFRSKIDHYVYKRPNLVSEGR